MSCKATTSLFVTFFIYGPDNKPTWYTAQLTLDASGNYNGQLYATTGTYYAMPWKASDQTTVRGRHRVVSADERIYGEADLRRHHTRTHWRRRSPRRLQRQTLTRITIGGTYIGAQSGAYSGCSNGSNNGRYSDFFNLHVNQSTSGSRYVHVHLSELDVHVVREHSHNSANSTRYLPPPTCLRRRLEHQRVDDGDQGDLARHRGQVFGADASGAAAARTPRSRRCSTSTSPGPSSREDACNARCRRLVLGFRRSYRGVPC